MVRMEAASENEARIEFTKPVMTNKEEDQKEDLETTQESIEEAAKQVTHTTKSERDEVRRTPEKVRIREEAAARCTKVIKRRVFRKQARNAKADHLVKCSMMPGEERVTRTLLTEFYVNGKFTKDRGEWCQELQRHCEEVHMDPEETQEVHG